MKKIYTLAFCLFLAGSAICQVGINTLTPVHTFEVAPLTPGDTATIGIFGPQPKIVFGNSGDVNLYRSDDNKLTTDDTLIIKALGINNANPSPSAILDISSTNKGVLFPRMTTANRNAIATPQAGLMIFNTTTNCIEFYVGGSWQPVACGCTTPPSPPVTVSGTSTNLCISGSYNYSISAVYGATSYLWAVNGTGATITGGQGTTGTTITFANTSPTTVSVSAVNNCGTGVAATLPISFTPIPATPGAITASAATACPNQTGLTFSVTPVANATSYNWNLPAGATITAGATTNSIIVNWGTVAGNVSVSATGCNGTSAVNTPVAVTMPAPSVPGTPTASTITPCAGQTGITLSAAPPATPGPGGVTSYTWTLPVGTVVTNPAGVTVNGSGITSPTTNSITVTWTNTVGSGNVSVLATNCNGNSGSSGTLATTMPVPGAPTVNTATSLNTTEFTANWSSPGGVPAVSSYRLDVSTSATFSSGMVLNDVNVGNVTSYNVTGLTCNTTYYYRVRAANCNGAGANSGSVTVVLYCRTCNGIKTAYPSAVDGNYTIDPDGSGGIAPLTAYCDMTTNGGGWTQLSSSLTSLIPISSGASWSGSNVVGNALGGGCGGVTQYTLNTPIIQFTSVYVLLTRTTSILQCSNVTGQYNSGFYSGTYNGSFTSAAVCTWGDGYWANTCCNPLNMTGLQLNWVFFSNASNSPLTWSIACSDASDNRFYTMRWFVK